jgi:phage baseplate assembly protein W
MAAERNVFREVRTVCHWQICDIVQDVIRQPHGHVVPATSYGAQIAALYTQPVNESVLP